MVKVKSWGTNGKSINMKSASNNGGGGFVAENRVFQELREINNNVKEVKKFMIINSLRQLVENYDKQTENRKSKLEKDWELANKDKQRNKEIVEWDRIQAEDDENLDS